MHRKNYSRITKNILLMLLMNSHLAHASQQTLPSQMNSCSCPPPMNNGAQPQMNNGAQPQMNNGAQPQMNNSAQPQMNNSAQPQMNNGAQPQMNNSAQPPMNNSAQPQMNNSAQPPMNNGAQPQMNNGAQPQMNNGAQPQMNNGAQPQMNNGAQPPMNNGAQPQESGQAFDQNKWNQLIKEAALPVLGQNTPAGLSEKQIVEILRTYALPHYANMGPDYQKNIDNKNLMIDFQLFSKDLYSGKYCTNGQVPPQSNALVELDNSWKKQELLSKIENFHNRGYWTIRYPGHEKAAIQWINRYITLPDVDRKKMMAYTDLVLMILRGQFPYDKYQQIAIQGGYLKKFNKYPITIKYEGTSDDGPLTLTVGRNGPTQKTYTVDPGKSLSLEQNTVPFVPPYGLALGFNGTKNYPVALGLTTEETKEITVQRPDPAAGVKNIVNGKLAGNTIVR